MLGVSKVNFDNNLLKKIYYYIRMVCEGKSVLFVNLFNNNRKLISYLSVNGIKITEVDFGEFGDKSQTLFFVLNNYNELNYFKNNFIKYYSCFNENLFIWIKNKNIDFNDLEMFLFENKMCKHPLYYEFNSFTENSVNHIFGIYVKANLSEDAIFNLKQMKSEANLHLDMSRVNGIRSAGHIIRYKIASDFIRIGDVVLDCACGLGYGSNILAKSAAKKVIGVDYSDFAIGYASHVYGNCDCSFIKGDAQNLHFIPDNSIDFVAAFETLEHIPQPDKFLEEALRVLKPSGRIMVSVPNNWADISGKDPNPEHLHVYDEKSLESQISKRFLPELKWALTMNRYYKNGKEYSSEPFLVKYSLEEVLPENTECILYLAMKDPLLGCGISYKESSWGIYGQNHVLLNFEKYYSNPYLIKGFQSYGTHENTKIRKEMADRILNEYAINTPEYGGSLCFLGYRELEKDILSEDEFCLLRSKIDEYVIKNNDNNLHVFRWKISLAYLMGCICIKNNNYILAKKYFMNCVCSDVTKFSPTLGTKILSAYRYLADLSTDMDEKVIFWRKSLEVLQGYFSKENWSNIIGSTENPFPVGLEDMKNILAVAEKSAWDILLKGNQFANKGYGLRDELKRLYECEETQKLVDNFKILSHKLEYTEQRVKSLENNEKMLQHEIANLRLSRSWRITKPLRKIGDKLRKLKYCVKNLTELFDPEFKKVLALVKIQRKLKGTICIFSPMYNEENLKDGYYRRVNALDQIFKGYLKIHINTVNWDNYKLKIEFYDDDVINIAYDPGATIQILQLRYLLFLSGRMYTHSIWQMKKWALDTPYVKKFVDLHGVVPEEYRLYGDYINAQEAEELEQQVVQKVNYMIAVTNAMKEHMLRKYSNKIKAEFILMPIYEEHSALDNRLRKIKPIENGTPVVIYAGGTQKWQLIPEMQDAMISTKAKVLFEICVPSPSEFFSIWNTRKQIGNMNVASKTHEEVLKLYERSHYGFVLREDIAVNNVACPTKLIEYIENDIVPILSTPKVGDFYKMGMNYITLEDFIDGKLPSETERSLIAENNKLVLKICKEQYLDGKKMLLERMK